MSSPLGNQNAKDIERPVDTILNSAEFTNNTMDKANLKINSTMASQQPTTLNFDNIMETRKRNKM